MEFITPLSEIKHVKDGKFYDNDGSIYVLPPNVCKDIDDDCALDNRMTKAVRRKCALYKPWRGKCPFVPD